MLFHVTISHSPEDCPGRRPDEPPDLINLEDRCAAPGDAHSVTAHSVVWGASCILWAEPEHVAYALLEAPNLDTVERYLAARIPAGWTMRPLPVFMLPSQLAAVRQVLAAPAMPSVQASVVPESPDDRDTDDTLTGLLADNTDAAGGGQVPQAPSDEARVVTLPPTVEPHDEPPGKQVTRPIMQPVVVEPVTPPLPPPPAQPVAADPQPRPDFGAVTRFIERPAILEASGGLPSDVDQTGTRAASVAADEPRSSTATPTVILEPKSEGPGLRLLASTGPSQGKTFEVAEDGATLGRLPENSICLTDGRLSRHHARIEFRDGGYWLSDLGSQNGTLVNDHALSEAHLLQAGDTIELGTTRLTVMLEPDD